MNLVRRFREELIRLCPDIELREGADMSALTSFRVGGRAEVLAEPRSGEQMAACMRAAYRTGARPLWMGRGTNILLEDGKLNMAIVRLGEKLRGINPRAQSLELYCGAPLAAAAAAALRCSLT